jgi:endonuclease/exonuclease/phosphatase family metal-dependent hydrolase
VRALSWNLFHGRDFPPDPVLATWRSRLTRRPERNDEYIQLNRDLYDDFAGVLAGADWEVALLQECPPRWSRPFSEACEAEAHRVLTARNWLLPLTSAIASYNPDLIASWEGGSNLTLTRGDPIVERLSVTLRLLPERRRMALTRLASGLCVANLHVSGADELAEPELLAAADRAVGWSGDAGLIFGGDLNLRPADTDVFAALERRHGLRHPTAPHSIDHLLSRGLDVVEPPAPWPAEAREVHEEGLRVRLSDHAPVSAALRGQVHNRVA